MSYHVTHRNGRDESMFPFNRLGELLDELEQPDPEHPDVSVTHESGWCLSVFGSGWVSLEKLDEEDPMHMGPQSRTEAIALMRLVAGGSIAELLALPWRPGYPQQGSRECHKGEG